MAAWGRTPRCVRAGVTLLELVIAMSLLIVLLGIGAVSYVGGYDARTVRKAASEVEAFASRGHAMSVLEQRPVWLEFEEGKVTLMGAAPRATSLDSEEFPEFGIFDNQEELNPVEVIDQFTTDVEVAIRRWGAEENDWVVPLEDQIVTWQFQATGLCEPLSLRFAYKDNWIILHMHPLTARAEDEELHIQ